MITISKSYTAIKIKCVLDSNVCAIQFFFVHFVFNVGELCGGVFGFRINFLFTEVSMGSFSRLFYMAIKKYYSVEIAAVELKIWQRSVLFQLKNFAFFC